MALSSHIVTLNRLKTAFSQFITSCTGKPSDASGVTGATLAAKINTLNSNKVPTTRTVNKKALSADISLTAGDVGAVTKTDLLSMIYPVGSIYMSVNATSPATFLGGTWERIQGKFLLAADDSTYKVGTSGGEATHTLTIDEMPKHAHPIHWAWSELQKGWGPPWRIDIGYLSDPNNSGVIEDPDQGVDYKGGSQPHNNMPPYLAVYIWKRTK